MTAFEELSPLNVGLGKGARGGSLGLSRLGAMQVIDEGNGDLDADAERVKAESECGQGHRH